MRSTFVSVGLFLCLFSQSICGISAHELLERTGVAGGLIVRVGWSEDKDLVDLGASPGFILHGLETDPVKIKRARAHLLSRGLYGKISVNLFDGHSLPYAENLVNLVIVDRPQIRITRQEILRVLAPNGVALVNGRKIQKPIPSDVDEWSHFEHGPENNAVAADTVVGPPRHLQWVAGPRWLRTHEEPSAISSMVTAGGRLFYTFDEGPIGISDSRMPEKWCLMARDAFNGTQLWKIPLPQWGWQTWKSEFKETFKGLDWIKTSGLRTKNPLSYLRRMVADAERLYFTLGNQAPVSIIDAATGKVTATCEGSDNPQKLLLCNGVLCVQLGQAIVAYEASTGRELWKKELPNIGSMAAHDGSVIYHANRQQLHSLDLKTGQLLWNSPLDVAGQLKISEGKVLSVTGGAMQVFFLDTGESLWCNQPKNAGKTKAKKYRGYYIIDNTIWMGYEGDRVDLDTGRPLPSLGVENLWSPQHHHRCYPNKATTRYIIGAMEGMEFLSLQDQGHSRNNWVRGSCSLGIMPANGMSYVPPDQCFCSAGVKLLGLNALCAAKTLPPIEPAETRLYLGPAFGKIVLDKGKAKWPAFRHDAMRSGSTPAQVPAQLRRAWDIQLDPSITQPVVSADRLFIASRDTHTVFALDSETGRESWRFTSGGRIDSSPTLWKGLLLFGSADGHLYCLRQKNGVLVWRFRAAPHQRLIQSFGQLESAWPLHGSVLILSDLAYVSAGRSTFLDGGLYLYALEPATGKVVYQHQELGPHEDHTQGFGHSFWSEGARNDVLVSDGESIYVMQLRFTKQLKPYPAQTESLLGDRKFGRHIFSTAGFLDDEWYNRAFWMNSTIWPGFYLANQASKSGQLLVANETTTFGVKAFWTRNRHAPMFFPGTKGYLLFADDNDSEPILVGRDQGTPLTWLPPFNMDKGKKRKTNWGPKLSSAPQKSSVDAYTYNKDKGIGFTRTQKPIWSVYVPIRVKAMVSTREKLFVAGAPDVFDEKDDPLGALEGRKGGVLRAVSAKDGLTLGEYTLDAPPVLDGLIAVQGKLFLATGDGRLSCWE
jgi:outer membrane protein assembly factor BamB